MPYEFHDTSHVEKRARERGFTVEQAMLAINVTARSSRLRHAPAIMAECFGCSFVFSRVQL